MFSIRRYSQAYCLSRVIDIIRKSKLKRASSLCISDSCLNLETRADKINKMFLLGKTRCVMKTRSEHTLTRLWNLRSDTDSVNFRSSAEHQEKFTS